MNITVPLEESAFVDLPAGRLRLFILWFDQRPVAQLWCAPNQSPEQVITAFVRSLELPALPTSLPVPSRSVSVVICTRDRADELARCLETLPRQTRAPDEIIVVDNASRGDRTREVAVAAGVTYVREDRPGLDFARNTGARAARSDIIAYTDDDTEIDPRWLERTVLAFDHPKVMAVTGLVLPARIDTEAQWLFETEWSFGRGFARIDYDTDFYLASRKVGCPAWIIGAGANMAFRREIFDLIGLFDERLDVGAAGCSGDSEYWYRILAAGYTCRYEPSAIVHHHHRTAMDGLKKQIHDYMRGHVAALMVQHERTGDRGNLRRAFLTMPVYYMKLAASRLIRGRTPRNQLVWEQISGSIAGLVYYLKVPRPDR